MAENGGIIEPGHFPMMSDGPGPEALYVPKDVSHIYLDARSLLPVRRERPMKNFAEVTVKVNAEMTPESRRVIRETVVDVLKEAMSDAGVIVFESKDALAKFVRTEFNKLVDERFLHE